MDWTPERVRALRKRLGLTQAEMARELGYSGNTRIAELETDADWGRAVSGPVGRLLDHLDQRGPLETDDRPDA